MRLLKAQEEKLRAQNVQLDAALNNMVQGLAMFDAEQRLVVCNARYAEIYELSPEQVKPGVTLLQIIEQRVKNGLTSEKSPEEIVELDAAAPQRRRLRAVLQRAERRPLHCRFGAGDGRRRHGHHAPGHHRAAPRPRPRSRTWRCTIR